MKVKNILAPVTLTALPNARALFSEIETSASAPNDYKVADSLKEIARLKRVYKEKGALDFNPDPYAPTAWVAEAIFNAYAKSDLTYATGAPWSRGVYRAAEAGYCLHLDN